MSIERVTGNALDFPAGIQVLGHCVSRRRVLGAGIAKQIADEYPAAADAYHASFKPATPPLGSIIPAEVSGGKRIVHFFAQDDIGTDKRQLDYEALYVCLEQMERLLREAAASGRNWTLGLPHGIGCGLAGGEWSICERMIEHIFGQSSVRCVIVKLPDKAALASTTTLPAAAAEEPAQ